MIDRLTRFVRNCSYAEMKKFVENFILLIFCTYWDLLFTVLFLQKKGKWWMLVLGAIATAVLVRTIKVLLYLTRKYKRK